MKAKYIIKSVAGIMAGIMSFYGALPVSAAAYDSAAQKPAYFAKDDSSARGLAELPLLPPEEVPAGETAAQSEPAAPEEAPAGETAAQSEPAAPEEAPAGETAAQSEPAVPEETPAGETAAQSEPAAPEEVPAGETAAQSEPAVPEEATPEEAPAGAAEPERYRNGTIYIYNFEQLLEIGTGSPLLHAQSGEPYRTGAGEEVRCTKDAQYTVAAQIELPQGAAWQMPQDFAGRIAPQQASAAQKPLYDAQSDTVYLYHPHQLEALADEAGGKMPVMSGDADAASFGTGQLIYPNGENAPFLTYAKEHRYVLSPQFCSDLVELLNGEIFSGPAEDGRDFAGQLIKQINGVDYILIGNQEQLRAIGSDKPLKGAVYQTYQTGGALLGSWHVDVDANGAPIMLYGGDADLLQSQNRKKDYAFGQEDAPEDRKKGRCGVDPKTGQILPDPNADDLGKTYRYSDKANYIIFRDIDLENVPWDPLEFSGNMIGSVAPAGESLWGADGSIVQHRRPVISNIQIEQVNKRNSDETMGVGFFSTLESKPQLIGNSLVSPNPTIVENLLLENISVTNRQNVVHHDASIIGALVGLLGKLLDGVLDILLKPFTGVSIRDLVAAILDARSRRPDFYATGAFAGRIIGNTQVKNCEVRNVNVSSTTSFTGGFAGYTEGTARYLLDQVDRVLEILTKLLDAVPWLGLGDLVKVLFKLINIKQLIATGYDNPLLQNCVVSNLSGTLGNQSTPAPASIGDQKVPSGRFAGGFAGAQIGTKIIGCTVQNSSYTVLADQFAGGFSGAVRDGEIDGVLQNIGVELIRVLQPQSLLQECKILDSDVKVTGGSYLGGLAGALAGSYAVNDTITGSVNVSASGSYAGGAAGIATLGWASDLGKDEVGSNSLLATVKKELLGILGGSESSAILSLVGLSPSAILGVQMDSTGIRVSAGADYAGGILGRGDGASIAATGAYRELPAWKHGSFPVPAEMRAGFVKGLVSVQASGSYAGGAAGSIMPTSGAGVLDGTLGLAHMIGFTLSDLTAAGSGFSVTAGGKYAGGMIGEAMGGRMENDVVSGAAKVEAQGCAGGFAGAAGPGDLAGSGGLKLKLLGLTLLEVKNLLSVGQAVRVIGKNCTVTGGESGLAVTARGSADATDADHFTAAGFAAKANSTEWENCHVQNLRMAAAPERGGYAGGFVGTSESGGLADVADEGQLEHLISINNLVTAVGYLIPKYTNCTVSYQNGGVVQADLAGGFAADFRSGKVDNTVRGAGDFYAVYNIGSVKGQSYAGGFGARVTSGALANAAGGVSVLGKLANVTINVADLLSVVEAYVPYITKAGVYSPEGFTVSAPAVRETDSGSGSAGGLIGYVSGAQVSACDVSRLKYTKVTPPKDMEAIEAPSYFDGSSSYAVHGARYAGGCIGCMNIGSAASLGGGLKILGKSLLVQDVLKALSCVISTVEHSDVTGSPGGFSVLGDHSGGFAGKITGGHVQNSHVNNFSYIIGNTAAGGYTGTLMPGNVANVLESTDLLSGLVSVDRALASVAENFVPTIRNSTACGIPCGGAVRAQEPSVQQMQKGTAGGFVGLNEGGHIWGNDTHSWKKEKTYTGPQSECAAERISSVYGYEYSGGFTGLMRSADTVSAGGIRLLGGLIEAGNVLDVLSVVYPTQTNTAVYGPLAKLDVDTWNAWVAHVGKYGGRGQDLAALGPVKDQAQLDAVLGEYIDGCTAAAGRTEYDAAMPSEGAAAGGYVGSMISGVITNGQAHHVKEVKAMGNAGGYAGKMRPGGAAEFGTVKILGLKLNLDALLKIAQFFVPVIKGSSVEGCRSGMKITASGKNPAQNLGNAGGFVGSAYGAQIWGDEAGADTGCNVHDLQRVTGNHTAGGYAGFVTAGAVAKVSTNLTDNMLQSILDHIIGNLSDLVSVMDATVSTIRKAEITPADAQYGFVVGGDADYSGGFGGWLEAAVIGSSKNESQICVQGVRYVEGGLYAGGFFGLADVTGAAQVGGKTNIAELIKAGRVDVLDAFRTYIYHADVHGVPEGMTVLATRSDTTRLLDSERHMGSAGGFGGGMMNGSIHNSSVDAVNTVQGLNYVGGFVGHLGKNGVVKLDSAKVHELIGLNAGVLNLFGAHAEGCSVSGIASGFDVRAVGGRTPMAGGFTGYADLSRVKKSTVTNLKKTVSDQIAGGFAGKTDMDYIVKAQVDSALVDLVLKIVNKLVRLLYLDKVQGVNLITIQLPPPLNILELRVMGDGKVLYVNLLGIRISAALSKADPAHPGQTDTVLVTIGDSQIRLPCSENGVDTTGKHAELELALIKGNRTKIEDCAISGVALGYDVYGGGAGDLQDGTQEQGYAGGFVGLNHEGVLARSQMYWCDVVRGTPEKTGPFTGKTMLDSVYDFNTIKSIEGDGNTYRVYRPQEKALPQAETQQGALVAQAVQDDTYNLVFSRFDITHLDVIREFADFENAVMTDAAVSMPLGVYSSSAKAVLMRDTALSDNHGGITPEPGESPDPCKTGMNLTVTKVWKDWYNPSQRPNSIQVEIRQSYTDVQNVMHDVLFKTITLSQADAQKETRTWKQVLEDLPAAKTERIDGEEVIYYYRYTVREIPVPGYTSQVSSDKAGQIIITNTASWPELPHAGGAGDWCFIAIGGAFVLLGLTHRKRREKVHTPAYINGQKQ